MPSTAKDHGGNTTTSRGRTSSTAGKKSRSRSVSNADKKGGAEKSPVHAPHPLLHRRRRKVQRLRRRPHVPHRPSQRRRPLLPQQRSVPGLVRMRGRRAGQARRSSVVPHPAARRVPNRSPLRCPPCRRSVRLPVKKSLNRSTSLEMAPRVQSCKMTTKAPFTLAARMTPQGTTLQGMTLQRMTLQRTGATL